MSDKETIEEALEHFRRCEEAEQENRANWLDDFKFARLGEQWPPEAKRQRELDGRPCLTINRLPSFIRQVTNDARQNKPSIKCHPVDSEAKREVGEILDGLIRNIEYTSNADVAYDTALDHAVTGGFGYFRINTAYTHDDQWEQDIVIERVANPLSIYGDVDSTAADSSDWNKAFVTDLLDKEDFKKRYKGADCGEFEADDKAKDQSWFSDDKIRIAEYWTRESIATNLIKLTDGTVLFEEQYKNIKETLDNLGITVEGTRPTRSFKVQQRIITGSEVLETNKWAGKYIPIVPVYGDEVMLEGKRHLLSLVRFAKDPQQMLNYWRTASTELVALTPKTPFIGPKGAFTSDAQKWATANSKSHAYIEYDGPQPPQRQPFAGPPAGALQEALNASDDMKSIMGIYDASLGARSNETSGRAIMARQREGDVGTFNYIDNLSRAIRHAGRILVDLIPKVYEGPRVIRVLHENGDNELTPINQPLPPEMLQKKQMEQQQKAQDEAKELLNIYDVTVGKYDVTVEAGPSYTTQREEAAQQMIQFTQANPQLMPIIGDLIAKNLDWPGADDIADRLKKMLPPPLQGANPQAQQLQQQLQQMDGQAKQAVGQLQQELAQAKQALSDKQAEFQLKAKELSIKEAETQAKLMQMQKPDAMPESKDFEVWKMQFEAQQAERIEQLKAESAERLELLKQANAPVVAQETEQQLGGEAMMQTLQSLVETLGKPKQVVRDASGRVVGITS
jgi:hypothetical protein